VAWTVFSVFSMVATGVPARIFPGRSQLAHNFEFKQLHAGRDARHYHKYRLDTRVWRLDEEWSNQLVLKDNRE
jgi:hypothetical protein